MEILSSQIKSVLHHLFFMTFASISFPYVYFQPLCSAILISSSQVTVQVPSITSKEPCLITVFLLSHFSILTYFAVQDDFFFSPHSCLPSSISCWLCSSGEYWKQERRGSQLSFLLQVAAAGKVLLCYHTQICNRVTSGKITQNLCAGACHQMSCCYASLLYR